MVTALFSAREGLWHDYREPLWEAADAAGLDVKFLTNADPATVDYIVYAPNGPVEDFRPFIRAKAVLGLWAGVEDMVSNPTLALPLARMVDPGLATGMAEWVAGHVMRYHLGLDADIANSAKKWTPRVPPLATSQTVAILGHGALGQASGRVLRELGFNVCSWARREPRDSNWPVLTGPDGLNEVLGNADYLVLLLPLTKDTENVLNDDALAALKPGAIVINPGRGALIDDDALMRALDAETVRAATLDVFRQEPLPKDHPFWQHPAITVTPHIASATRPDTASEVIVENIRRGESGERFLHLVDRKAGY